MPDFATLKRQWGELTAYERFERVSRIVMLLISLVIVYSLFTVSIELFNQFTLDPAFADVAALKDVFGSIFTILILIEFNHSIALAITNKSGVLQARYIVLITILVIARKVILLDFSTASFESLVGISGITLAFGLLYWLISLRSSNAPADSSQCTATSTNEPCCTVQHCAVLAAEQFIHSPIIFPIRAQRAFARWRRAESALVEPLILCHTPSGIQTLPVP